MSLIEIEKKIKFKNFVDLSKEEALQIQTTSRLLYYLGEVDTTRSNK